MKKSVALVLISVISVAVVSVGIIGIQMDNQSEQNVEDTDFQSSYEELYDEVKFSVVTIYVTDSQGNPVSQGSGFIYNEKGYIVTNGHVVANYQETQNISLRFANNEWRSGSFVGRDRYTDVAVLVASSLPEEATPLKVAEELPERGERVVAVGSPRNYEESITTGVVSGLNRSMSSRVGRFLIPDTIQTDAALDRGNSGGPLINLNKEVVGINRAVDGRNVGLAVSNRILRTVVPSIIETGSHDHALVGVVTRNNNPTVPDFEEPLGLKLVNTTDSVQLVSGDLERNEIITNVDGVRLYDNEDLASYILLNKEPGDTLTITKVDDGEKEQATVRLSSRDQL